MKKWLIGIVGSIAVVVLAGWIFREPLMAAVVDRMTANMFVAEDADSYDPGIAVGERLPAVRALHDGTEVVDLNRFAGPKGMVLFVNRSVDW